MSTANLPGYGYGDGVGFGLETAGSYGQVASSFVWLRPRSNELVSEDPPLMLGGPTGSNQDFLYNASLPRHMRGMPNNLGPVTLDFEYDDCLLLLANAIDHPVSTDNTGGNNGHNHVFTLPSDNTGDMPRSLSVVRTHNITGASTDSIRHLGCVIDTLELRGRPTADQETGVSMTVTLAGQTYGQADHSFGTLSAAPFGRFHHSVVRYDASIGATPDTNDDLGSAAFPGDEVLEWVLRIENNLRRTQAASQADGTRGMREPIYTGKRRVTLEITKDVTDFTFQDLLFPEAAGAAETTAYGVWQVFLDSGVAADTNQNYDMAINIPAGLVMGDPIRYPGGGEVLAETITIQAADNGSGSIFNVNVNNATDNTTSPGSAYGN